MVARPFALRRLTAAERALGCEMFGAALELDRVRILALPLWKRAFVAGSQLVVWPAADLPEDLGAAPLAFQATFVHELTHVWQAQNGVRLLLAKLKAGDSAAAYAYDLSVKPDFRRLNIEQQAMVVEHAFLASRGARAPHSAALYAEASSAWRRT
jgi:ribosomal protein S18 acetylase RimI-like enzyme